jgi:DNA invertase Pin-like site-specific DNA recombinase
MGGAMGESDKTPRRSAKKARCAIYTRKSSEEGLEQAFNSLDAQREACAAFILSQKHEGWTVLPTLYDDGGFSGGTMERPALKRLIADIEAGQIDVIVVYKVDRLALFGSPSLPSASEKMRFLWWPLAGPAFRRRRSSFSSEPAHIM